MLQNPLNDRGLLYDENNLHVSITLRALQGINVPDLLQENCPLLSSAPGAGRAALR